MSLPSSDLFSVEDIPGAGRGVVATQQISRGDLVLRGQPPAAHLIFWQHRKGVCAQCFHYNRGRKLPIRLNSAGKVFCTPECRTEWLREHGQLGLEVWEILNSFVQRRSRDVTNNHSLTLLAPRPDSEEIEAAWSKAEEIAQRQRDARVPTASDSGSEVNPEDSCRRVLPQIWKQAVDPDVLGHLLSGVLFHHKDLSRWDHVILDLAKDESPYRSTLDLEAYCNSFLQLTAIMPYELLPSLTPSVCQTLISVASHNSFGIHSGSEDGDEYLGYALYPNSSYFNHSCKPNMAKNRAGRIWEFRASENIDVDEECCITYLGGDEKELSLMGRRGRLQGVWEFECMCERCKQEAPGD